MHKRPSHSRFSHGPIVFSFEGSIQYQFVDEMRAAANAVLSEVQKVTQETAQAIGRCDPSALKLKAAPSPMTPSQPQRTRLQATLRRAQRDAASISAVVH